ncbi:MAG: hypothetical protein ACRD0H_26915, partial [Actinomycetes bacterium]
TARLAHWQEQHAATAGIRNLTPGRRHLHADAAIKITTAGMAAERARTAVDDARHDLDHLKSQQAARARFDRTNQWRAERVSQLDHQADQQWTAAVVSAARDGHPHAYGTGHLRAARRALAAQINVAAKIAAPVGGQTPTAVGDPLRALADIDRAVADTASAPTPQLARRLTPAATRPSVHQGHHHPVQAPQAAAPAPAPRPPTIQP